MDTVVTKWIQSSATLYSIKVGLYMRILESYTCDVVSCAIIAYNFCWKAYNYCTKIAALHAINCTRNHGITKTSLVLKRPQGPRYNLLKVVKKNYIK